MDADGLFPGAAASIPLTHGPGWIIERADLSRVVVRHGSGYKLFAEFCDDRGPGAARLTNDPRALLQFLGEHVEELRQDVELARAADVFLGNCLNLAYGLAWISSQDLAIASDELSVTIEGTALILAAHPEHQEPLLTRLAEHGAEDQASR